MIPYIRYVVSVTSRYGESMHAVYAASALDASCIMYRMYTTNARINYII